MQDASTYLNTGGLSYIVGNEKDSSWNDSDYLNTDGLKVVADIWKHPEDKSKIIQKAVIDSSCREFLDIIGLMYIREKYEKPREKREYYAKQARNLNLEYDVSSGKVTVSTKDGTDISENEVVRMVDGKCGDITEDGKFTLYLNDEIDGIDARIVNSKVYIDIRWE